MAKKIDETANKIELFPESFSEETGNEKIDNPFIELRHLITNKDIDVKTILTDEQIVMAHKLNNLSHILIMSEDEDAEKGAERLNFFINNMFSLRINKDGTSRKQFIEALHKGSERAEQAKNERLQKIMGL
jgi:hypothetical protein